MTGRHRSGDTPSDDRGRTFWGRARDRVTGDGTDDRGNPEAISGRRADRRARRTQTVRYGLLGGVRESDRERKARDLRDRWR